MSDRSERAVAIVGLGAILPDAPSARAFRENVWAKKYSITEVPPDRWSVADYYDPDPSAPAKTYSKIGVLGARLPVRLEALAHPAPRGGRDGRGPAVGDHDRRRGPRRLRLPAEDARHRAHGRRPRQRDGGGAALPDHAAHLVPRVPRSCSSRRRSSCDLPAEVREAILARWREVVSKRLPEITEDTMPGELSNILSGPRGQRAQPARAELHRRRGLRLDLRRARRRGGHARGGPLRRRGHGRRRPQHGHELVREVLEDRGALRHRHAAVRRRRRRLRDGRGLGGVPAQAPGRRRAGRRPRLRGRARASAAPRTARARASRRRTRSGSGSPSRGRGRTRGSTRPRPASSRPTARARRSATWSRWRASPRCSRARRRARSPSARRRATSATSRRARARPGLLKAVWAVHEKVLPPTLHADPPNPGIDFAATPFVAEPRPAGVEAGETARRGGAACPPTGSAGRTSTSCSRSTCPARSRRGERPGAGRRARARSRAAAGSSVALLAEAAPARPPRAGRGVGGRPPRGRGRDAAAGEGRPRAARRSAPLPPALAARERMAIDYGDGKELRRAAAEGAEGPRHGRARHLEGLPGPGRLPRQRAAPRARSRSSSPARAAST